MIIGVVAGAVIGTLLSPLTLRLVDWAQWRVDLYRQKKRFHFFADTYYRG